MKNAILTLAFLALAVPTAFGQTLTVKCKGTYNLGGSYSCEDNGSGMGFISGRGFVRKVAINFTKNIELKPYVRDWWFKADLQVPVSAAERKILLDQIKKDLGSPNRPCTIDVNQYSTFVDLEYDSRTQNLSSFRVDGRLEVESEGKNAGLFYAGIGSVRGVLHCSVRPFSK